MEIRNFCHQHCALPREQHPANCGLERRKNTHTHKERKALQNKEPYLRANIRSYLLTKRKKLENKRIYFRTKQKAESRY